MFHRLWQILIHFIGLFSLFSITNEISPFITDVTMTEGASQITSLTIVNSAVYSGGDQRKHQSSASLAFVWGIHRDRWIPRTKGQLRGKCFHLMTSSWHLECCFHGHTDMTSSPPVIMPLPEMRCKWIFTAATVTIETEWQPRTFTTSVIFTFETSTHCFF